MRARDAAELGRLSAALKRSEEAVGIAEAALTDEAELRARADSETAAAQCELTALHEAAQRAASELLRVREQAELRVQRAEASEAQVSGRLQCLRCAQHRDWAHPCQHLHQDWLTPGTSASELAYPCHTPGLGPPLPVMGLPLPHLHRDSVAPKRGPARHGRPRNGRCGRTERRQRRGAALLLLSAGAGAAEPHRRAARSRRLCHPSVLHARQPRASHAPATRRNARWRLQSGVGGARVRAVEVARAAGRNLRLALGTTLPHAAQAHAITRTHARTHTHTPTRTPTRTRARARARACTHTYT